MGHEELNNFNNYGWFQFSSVKNAISSNQNLEDALSDMSSLRIQSQKKETFKYKVDDKMAIQVIGDATKILRNWDIILPKNIKIVFVMI